MAKIPQSILDVQPVLRGLTLRSRGKVRDSYDLPNYQNIMLVVASDRCSIFDFVLNTLILLKGQILTALNHFWTEKVILEICETDLVECGAGIDAYLPERLRNNPDLQKRATVVKLLAPPEVEDVVRLHLTGSGWASYQKSHTVCGHKLPQSLIDGSKLPYPIYTPTTKADVGHDEPVSADSVADRYGIHRERLSLQVAQAIASYAENRGIILADTKFEFSYLPDPEFSPINGRLILADEKGTPDSSRFWDALAWKKAHENGKLPPAFDKQFVREWGKKALIDKDPYGKKREPENSEDLAYVHSQVVPENVVRKTTLLYRYIFWRLTGMRIEVYQKERMGIAVEPRIRTVEILVGSESDLRHTKDGLAFLKERANVSVSVVSCHRNPSELHALAKDRLKDADVVVAGAGMAAALPGIVKSELCALYRPDIPVIGVAFPGTNDRENQAAILSIECLPGKPVELNWKGEAHFGCIGFTQACLSAAQDEFLPKTIEPKPAMIDFK